MKHYDILFDGPPRPEAGQFVEVEDENGISVRVGEWIERDDGLWTLRIPNYADVEKAARNLYDNRLFARVLDEKAYAPEARWNALGKALEAVKEDD